MPLLQLPRRNIDTCLVGVLPSGIYPVHTEMNFTKLLEGVLVRIQGFIDKSELELEHDIDSIYICVLFK